MPWPISEWLSSTVTLSSLPMRRKALGANGGRRRGAGSASASRRAAGHGEGDDQAAGDHRAGLEELAAGRSRCVALMMASSLRLPAARCTAARMRW